GHEREADPEQLVGQVEHWAGVQLAVDLRGLLAQRGLAREALDDVDDRVDGRGAEREPDDDPHLGREAARARPGGRGRGVLGRVLARHADHGTTTAPGRGSCESRATGDSARNPLTTRGEQTTL